MTDTSLIDDRAEALILALVEEGIFQIDECGQIWRMRIKHGDTTKPVLPEPRRAEYLCKGYLRIRVSTNGVRIRVSAHRVVWRYFNGDIPDGCIIDHKDEVRHNNRPGNLQAVTQVVNVRLSIERRKHAQGEV